MKSFIQLGEDLTNRNARVQLPADSLSRHTHLIGATGSGKTVLLHGILRHLMKESRNKSCLFIIDGLGGLSQDLLHWMTTLFCPEHVRRRLIYIEPANTRVVTPFNPLRKAVGDARYFHVGRTVDLFLRAWRAQDLGSQPRLMQWAYSAMAAVAALGIPISLSRYLLRGGSPEHESLMRQLPQEIRYRWDEILSAKGNEALKVLDSTRNRFDPFYEAPQTNRMFGTTDNRFDVEQMIRDRRIVILNLAGLGALTRQLANTIGALVLNEIFDTAFRLATTEPRQVVEPTYLVLDEFQRFAASPDIQDAIPTVRQVGLRLLMAHQSFSQLLQDEIDLRTMIWQAQNRFAFANSAEDADLIANELAILTFNSMDIKLRLESVRQRVAGHRIVWLKSRGINVSSGEGSTSQDVIGFGQSLGKSWSDDSDKSSNSESESSSRGQSTGRSKTVSTSESNSESQSVLPILEDIKETSSIQFRSFDEFRLEWMKIIRQLKTGNCFAKLYNDDHLYKLKVDYRKLRDSRDVQARIDDLKQRNYEQDLFISSAEADRLREEARQQLLARPRISLPGPITFQSADQNESGEIPPVDTRPASMPDPFRKPKRKD